MERFPPAGEATGSIAGTLRQAGLVVVGLTVASKAVGFLREIVIAAAYGTSGAVDLYLAAVIIPTLIGSVLYHSLPNSLVPLFSDVRSHNNGGRRIASAILIAMATLAGIIWIGAPWVSSLTSAGFPPHMRVESVVILRIVSATILFIGAEAVARSRLLARKRFTWAGLGFLWQSGTMIAAIALYPEGGARTLAWGYCIGTLAAMLWGLLGIRGLGRAVDLPAGSSGPFPLPALSWILIVLLTDSLSQLYALLDRHYAAVLPTGAMASLQYASLITTAPLGIAGLALSSAIFPYLSDAVVANDLKRASQIFDRGIRWSLVVAVPAFVVCLVLSEPSVRLALERGAFRADSRLATAAVVAVLAWGIIPGMLGVIVARFSYARGDWRTVFLAALAGLAAKLATLLMFADRYGTAEIASSTVVGYFLTALVLLRGVPWDAIRSSWREWLKLGLILGLGFYSCSILGIWAGSLVDGSHQLTSAVALVVSLAGGSLVSYAMYRLARRGHRHIA